MILSAQAAIQAQLLSTALRRSYGLANLSTCCFRQCQLVGNLQKNSKLSTLTAEINAVATAI
jgi:hypothetical protein